MPGTNEPPDENRPHPVGAELGAQAGPSLASLTFQAFQLRSHQHHALHPVEAALQYHRASAEISGGEGHGGCGFAEAEAHYRAGAQGLRLSEIPQLPQQLRELSRLGDVDRAGRKALRKWAEDHGKVFDEASFHHRWESQGKRGGAEHQVYYDPETAYRTRSDDPASKIPKLPLPFDAQSPVQPQSTHRPQKPETHAHLCAPL